MYGDPALIRKHRVTLYLNDAEDALLDATNEYLGVEKAPLLRDLLLHSARLVLAGEVNLRPVAIENEAPQIALFKS